MAGAAIPNPTDQPLSVDDFAAKIKAKYPEYAQTDNTVLAQKIVDKYPEYAEKVSFAPKIQTSAPISYTGAPQQTNLTPVTDPALKQQIQQTQAAQVQHVSDQLKQARDTYDVAHPGNNDLPDEKDKLQVNTPERLATQKAMDTTLGKIEKSTAYIGSQALHGGTQVLKGGAWVLNHLNTGLNDTQTIPDSAFSGVDKFDDLGVTPGQKSQIEDNKTLGMGATRTLGMLANIAPAAVGGEYAELPKTVFALQGFGQGAETMDAVDPEHKLNPAVRDLYIAGNGAVNGLIMGDLKENVLSKPVQDKIVSAISADALKETVEKGLTEDAYKDALQKTTDKFTQKAGELLNTYAEKTGQAAKDFSALQAANYVLKKGVDVTSDHPVFNANLGQLMSDVSDVVTKQAPLFGGIGAMFGGAKADPTELQKSNLSDQIQKLTDTPADGIIEEKEKAVRLKDLNKQLDEVVANQYDQQKDRASGKKITYSKGIGEDEGKYFKKIDGQPEEITQSRYNLEKPPITDNLTPQNDEKSSNDTQENVGQETNGQKENAIPSEEEKVSDGAENAPLHKAVDAVTHGIVVPENIMGRDPSARFDFGMTTAEKQKAVSDIKKGDYETAPAKKMLSKLQEWDAKDEYPIIEGLGGNSKRSRFATSEDIQNNIDDAKANKIGEISERQVAEINKPLSELGFTHQDAIDYENYRAATEQRTDTGTVESTSNPVQQSENVTANGATKSTSNKTTQGDNSKQVDNAIQEQSTGKVDVQPETENGEGVGSGNAEPKEPAEQGKEIKDKAKALADRIRSLKSDRNQLHGGLQGVATAVYDGALETVATTIEKGGELVDAIKAGVKYITDKHPEIDAKDAQAQLENDINGEDDKQIYGTKNAITEELQKGLGLPPIEIPKDRSDDESLAAWKNGTRTPKDIIDALLSPGDIYDKSITPNDQPILREYIRQLGERRRELNKILAGTTDPLDEASVRQQINTHLDEYNDALNASKVGGNIWHKFGQERQKAIDDKGLLINAIDRIKNAYANEVPEAVAEQLKELQAKYEELEAKNTLLEKKLTEKAATNNIPKKRLFGTKKTGEQFVKERQQIVDRLKADWKKSFSNTYSTLPGAPQFNAIAPHITALVRSFAEQGFTKLDDVISKVHDSIKDVVEGITHDDIRDIIAGKYGDKKTLSELNKDVNKIRQQARLLKQISDLEKGISIKSKGRVEPTPEIADLQKKLADLKKQSLNEFAHLSADDLAKKAATIQKQIDKGDFFKVPAVKRSFETDPEWVRNNRMKSDLMFKLRKMEREAMDSKKGKLMRGLDWINRWGRRVIFFGANAVYTKLASAAVLGSFVHREVEQGLGVVNAKMFPNIARNAPIEGTINASSEAKFYGDFINPVKFLKNSWDIAKTGETELSRELGKQLPHFHIPVVDLFAADMHIMIKDPVKRATFEASLINHLKWYENNGVDGTHPMMLESARQAAWKRANYEIFQDSDPDGSKIKRYFNELEKSGIVNRNLPDTHSKLKGNAQYAAASLYHFFIPINTVPVNILKRVGLGLRLPITYIEAATKNKDVKNGILKLTNEESDAIMLQLKKGQVSAAYWTLGFVLAGSAAGGLYTKYYSDKDREQSATTPASDYLNGIPKNVQHNTQFQSLQMGATWKIVRDHYVQDNGSGQFQAIMGASFATAGAAAQMHPVIKAAASIHEAISTPQGYEKFKKDLKQRVGVNKASDVLKLMGYDTDDDNP